MKLCKVCDNILNKSTRNDTLKFICQTCFSEYDADDNDTLMTDILIEENNIFNSNSSLYKSEIYLNVARYDPLPTLVKKNCISCDETIIKRITLGENSQCIYVCPKCGIKFIK
jgi:hypothetical protein